MHTGARVCMHVCVARIYPAMMGGGCPSSLFFSLFLPHPLRPGFTEALAESKNLTWMQMLVNKGPWTVFWRKLGIGAIAGPGPWQDGISSPTRQSFPISTALQPSQMLKSGRQLRFLRLLLLSLGLAQRAACWSGGLEWPSPLPAWLQLCLCKHLLFKNYSCCLADLPCSHLSLPPLSLPGLPAVRMCRVAFC